MLHVPGNVVSVRSVCEPEAHTKSCPPIALGIGFTVTSVLAVQLVGSVYTTVTVPEDTPVSIPVDAAIVPVAAGDALHVPPVLSSLSGIVASTHTDEPPITDEGNGFTSNGTDSTQPVGSL